MDTNKNMTGFPPNSSPERVSNRKVLAVLGMIVALFGILWLTYDAPTKDVTIEATYNAETPHTQDRIADWLGGPDTIERETLRSWMAERGIEGSEALWLISASQEELDAAVDDLGIPECGS